MLIAGGLGDIAKPLTPQLLAKAHPAWAEEVARYHWEESTYASLPVYTATSRDEGTEEQQLAMPDSSAAPAVFICGACSSTFDVARRLHDVAAFNVWDSVLAVSQHSGRGQLRRPWVSPAGNIYATWRLPLHGPYADEMASLVAGVLLAEGFARMNVPVKIKWPNDLLLNDRKIAGILLEERGELLLAGAGINVHSHPPAEMLRAESAASAGAVHSFCPDLSIGALWHLLVKQGIFCYETQILRIQDEELTRRVQEHLAWVGREVHVHGGELDNRPGRILGVNQCGGLRIFLTDSAQEGSAARERVIYSGSITPVMSHHP